MLKNRMEELILASGKTRYRIAKDAEIAHSTMTDIYNSEDLSTKELGTILRLADAIGVDLEEMFERM